MEALQELNERLAYWRGARAEVWDYTVSHGIMRLHLSRGPNGPSAVLYMYDCRTVSFSSGWNDSAISARRVPTEVHRWLVIDGDNLSVDESGGSATGIPVSNREDPAFAAERRYRWADERRGP
jgi:hypothetical protein